MSQTQTVSLGEAVKLALQETHGAVTTKSGLLSVDDVAICIGNLCGRLGIAASDLPIGLYNINIKANLGQSVTPHLLIDELLDARRELSAA